MKNDCNLSEMPAPPPSRRDALKTVTALAGLLLASGYPVQAQAYSKAAFEAHSLQDATKALSLGAWSESRDVTLTVPDVAENGAAVSVTLGTGLAQVRQMLVLVDKNPTPLAARFVLTDAVEPQFATRIRMAETAQVYAVVILADGRVLFARKEVKVTLSGCGG
jgi:sulfur-oxidizing protein SoxY